MEKCHQNNSNLTPCQSNGGGGLTIFFKSPEWGGLGEIRNPGGLRSLGGGGGGGGPGGGGGGFLGGEKCLE